MPGPPFLASIHRFALGWKRWVVWGAILFAVSICVPIPESKIDQSLPASVRITDRNGVLLRDVRPAGLSTPVTIKGIHENVVRALIATEDSRFFFHPGIDPIAAIQSFRDNLLSGEVVRGGSTITMQVARMIRNKQHRNWIDKIAEIHLALRLEWSLSKTEILELWMNRAPFGNEVYGIRAASELYFAKPPSDLHLAEATLLIGLPQSPSRYNPFTHPDRAMARRSIVLDALEKDGVLSKRERQELEHVRMSLVRRESVFRAPHFARWTYEKSLARKIPASAIRTTLDWNLQSKVESVVRAQMRQLQNDGATNAAALVLDNSSGEILAYVGSVDFWDDHLGGQNDGVRMLRQPGSSVKPFTYSLALQSGKYTPASILADIETQIIEAGGAFSPDNYDKKYHGPVPLKVALASSYNIPAVRMARELGPERLLRFYRNVGLTTLTRSPEFYGVGLTLGNGEIRLIDLARAYAGFARGATLPKVKNILSVDMGGTTRPWEEPAIASSSSLNPQVAFLITDILSDPSAREPAFGSGSPLEFPFPVAVKTGTSKDYRDNWIVGYTPRHTVAVWVGNFDGSPMQYVSGVSGAGPIFHSIFSILGSGGDFHVPFGVKEIQYCPASGQLPGSFCPNVKTGFFQQTNLPVDTCTVHQNLRIDLLTGLLADADTPTDRAKEEVFTVHPPLFHVWMRDSGMRLPPLISGAEIDASDAELIYSTLVEIVYPADGTQYIIDPVLRRDYQKVRFQGVAHEPVFGMYWSVDGERIPGDPMAMRWQLQPGRHRIEMYAVTADGQRIRSRPAVITVSDPAGEDGGVTGRALFVSAPALESRSEETRHDIP